MTFYSVRLKNDNVLTYNMNPLIRGVLIFILASIGYTLLFNFDAQDFINASTAGKITTILIPLLFFLATTYRYSFTFNKSETSIVVRQGLMFFHKKTVYTFDDLTALDYRVYDFGKGDEGVRHSRGIPRRSKADFGFYFGGKLVQLERRAPKKGVEVLYLTFTTFFPRDLSTT